MKRPRPSLTAYVLLAAGLTVAFVAALAVRQATQRYDLIRFEKTADEAALAISTRIQNYVNALLQTRGLFEASSDVRRSEFRLYVDSTRLAREYPGIQGIGFVQRVRKPELKEHEAQVRAEGFPQYRVWPAGDRPEYNPIVYLEPFDWRNQRAFGFDMYSEPVRREAMDKARDTGEPAATKKVTLVQETEVDRQAGFLLYVALYERGKPTHTVAERREAFRGYVYAPFRAADLFKGIFPELGTGAFALDFEIFDGSTAAEAALLFDSDKRTRVSATTNAPFIKTTSLDVAGTNWTVVIAPRASFYRFLPHAQWLTVLIGGLFVAALLFWLKWLHESADQARIRALMLSGRMEVLANTSAAMSSSLNYRANLEKAARLLVPRFSSWCVVTLADEHGVLKPHTVVHGESEKQLELEEYWKTALVSHSKEALDPQRVFETRVPQNQESVPDGAYGALKVRSAICVPLVAREKAFGAIVFASSSRAYGAEDLAVAAEIGKRAGLAIDNALLFESAQDAVRIRDEFLSIASHELRTPITPLNLQIQMLLRQLTSDQAERWSRERIVQTLESSIKSVDRLTKLIDDLLDVSRIMNGRLRFKMERVNLAEVVEDIAARYAGELARHDSVLELELDRAAIGYWDQFRIEQVVVNLLSNALKYGEGSPLKARVTRDAEYAYLQVEDQGMGIAPEDQERIFRRFERVTTSTSISGLGLGLYIVHMIVQGHGGSITVDSALGEGSTFTVKLPLFHQTESQES